MAIALPANDNDKTLLFTSVHYPLSIIQCPLVELIIRQMAVSARKICKTRAVCRDTLCRTDDLSQVDLTAIWPNFSPKGTAKVFKSVSKSGDWGIGSGWNCIWNRLLGEESPQFMARIQSFSQLHMMVTPFNILLGK